MSFVLFINCTCLPTDNIPSVILRVGLGRVGIRNLTSKVGVERLFPVDPIYIYNPCVAHHIFIIKMLFLNLMTWNELSFLAICPITGVAFKSCH